MTFGIASLDTDNILIIGRCNTNEIGHAKKPAMPSWRSLCSTAIQ
ncbi:hypothetical protein [Paenibacillus anseongense]|nr:hypothetical protein [Paenibacillus anseongense]